MLDQAQSGMLTSSTLSLLVGTGVETVDVQLADALCVERSDLTLGVEPISVEAGADPDVRNLEGVELVEDIEGLLMDLPAYANESRVGRREPFR